MRLSFESEEDLRRYIAEQVLVSGEVQELFGVSRARIMQLVEAGRFTPFKEISNVRLYFRTDVEKALREMEPNRKKHGRKNVADPDK